MKKINKRTFIISTILCGLLLIPCFLVAYSEDEGTLGKNSLWIIFAKLYNILRFPTHILFEELFNKSVVTVLIGFIINCFFYGFLSERLISLLRRYNKQG